MASGEPRADWKLARRLALLADNALGHGIRRADACRELGLAYADLWPVAMGPAYGTGMVDICGDWIVAPAIRVDQAKRPVRADRLPGLLSPVVDNLCISGRIPWHIPQLTRHEPSARVS